MIGWNYLCIHAHYGRDVRKERVYFVNGSWSDDKKGLLLL